MMKKPEKLIITALAALLAVIALLLIGRAEVRDDSQQADTAVRYEIPGVQTATETAQTQDATQEQSIVLGANRKDSGRDGNGGFGGMSHA